MDARGAIEKAVAGLATATLPYAESPDEDPLPLMSALRHTIREGQLLFPPRGRPCRSLTKPRP
jgi:hypothetical protein